MGPVHRHNLAPLPGTAILPQESRTIHQPAPSSCSLLEVGPGISGGKPRTQVLPFLPPSRMHLCIISASPFHLPALLPSFASGGSFFCVQGCLSSCLLSILFWVSLSIPRPRPLTILPSSLPIQGPRHWLPGPHKVNKPSATEGDKKGSGASWGWEKPIKIKLTALPVLWPQAAGNSLAPHG